jgi:hypothetical protein
VCARVCECVCARVCACVSFFDHCICFLCLILLEKKIITKINLEVVLVEEQIFEIVPLKQRQEANFETQ